MSDSGTRTGRLWLRQSVRDTLWLLAHPETYRFSRWTWWFRVITGRCTTCGRLDCGD